ncbi:hypothetical protein DFH06DRAFT_1333708 [Mycena polygramma]|nr:hypothetical protein DFH06DRAFT_1333708 [Mycena polygramma]
MQSSRSESSGLARKRKADNVSPVVICQHVLRNLRAQQLFAAIDDDQWAKVSEKVLEDPELPGTAFSRPFTAALPFFKDMFEEPNLINVPQPAESLSSSDSPDPYEEAANNLRSNPLWQGLQDHLVMETEASCRSAIDLVMLSAVTLAQQLITSNPELNAEILERHSLPSIDDLRSSLPDTRRDDAVGARVVVHQEVAIPPQQVLPNLAFHGVLDYTTSFVSTEQVSGAKRNGPFMDRQGLHIDVDFPSHFAKRAGPSGEAKGPTTFSNFCSKQQVHTFPDLSQR